MANGGGGRGLLLLSMGDLKSQINNLALKTSKIKPYLKSPTGNSFSLVVIRKGHWMLNFCFVNTFISLWAQKKIWLFILQICKILQFYSKIHCQCPPTGFRRQCQKSSKDLFHCQIVTQILTKYLGLRKE